MSFFKTILSSSYSFLKRSYHSAALPLPPSLIGLELMHNGRYGHNNDMLLSNPIIWLYKRQNEESSILGSAVPSKRTVQLEAKLKHPRNFEISEFQFLARGSQNTPVSILCQSSKTHDMCRVYATCSIVFSQN